jgi:hypothetical protein
MACAEVGVVPGLLRGVQMVHLIFLYRSGLVRQVRSELSCRKQKLCLGQSRLHATCQNQIDDCQPCLACESSLVRFL